MTPLENWKQRALYQLMSDISEDCYCAGWMHGNEYTLWDMLSNPEGPRNYGQSEVTDDMLAELRAISQEVGGWIVWWDDGDERDLPPGEWGPRFLTFAEWQPMFDRRMAEWAALRARNTP